MWGIVLSTPCSQVWSLSIHVLRMSAHGAVIRRHAGCKRGTGHTDARRWKRGWLDRNSGHDWRSRFKLADARPSLSTRLTKKWHPNSDIHEVSCGTGESFSTLLEGLCVGTLDQLLCRVCLRVFLSSLKRDHLAHGQRSPCGRPMRICHPGAWSQGLGGKRAMGGQSSEGYTTRD